VQGNNRACQRRALAVAALQGGVERRGSPCKPVMLGLVPGIHVSLPADPNTWMAAYQAWPLGRLHACSLYERCVVRATASLNQAWNNETFFVYPPVAPNQR
jgi:hypothetical protein